MGLTETPRVVAGDCRLVWRRSNQKKAKTESPRLDILVTSSEEARMSQSSILVEDGGNGSHNPHEDLVRGCETEAEDPELVRPFSHHEAKITTRIVMRGTCR